MNYLYNIIKIIIKSFIFLSKQRKIRIPIENIFSFLKIIFNYFANSHIKSKDIKEKENELINSFKFGNCKKCEKEDNNFKSNIVN